VKKILFTLAVFGMMSGMSCDDDPKDNETNPYPDGVYPFEVTGVGHTWDKDDSYDLIISWKNPADGGFKRVRFELYYFAIEWGLIFTSDGENPSYPSMRDPVLGVNKFSMHGQVGSDCKAVIKCVDKFGNISGGVEYSFNLFD
jgi:hypothetical protein